MNQVTRSVSEGERPASHEVDAQVCDSARQTGRRISSALSASLRYMIGPLSSLRNEEGRGDINQCVGERSPSPTLRVSFVATLCWMTASVFAAEISPSVLHLQNGDFVAGALQQSDTANVLRWHGRDFTRPFEFPTANVSVLHFPLPAESPKPQGEYCFELAGDDVLFGSLLSLTADAAEIEVPKLGKVTLARSSIRRLYRWSGAELIYLGPNGLTGWKLKTDNKRWREEGGQPWTDQPGAVLFGDFGLPAQAVIEFELSWKTKPDFVFAVGTTETEPAAKKPVNAAVRVAATSTDQAFRFEVWDDELVVQREVASEADVASLQAVKGAGRTHLVAYCDQQTGRMLVYAPGGKLLADMKVSPKKPTVRSGMRLENKKGDVRLERLRISRWDGTPPKELQADKARLHRADGSLLYGQVTGYDAASKQFTLLDDDKKEARIPADQVTNVFLSPPNEVEPRAVRAVYLDGTRISGELNQVEAEHMRLTCPNLTDTLRLPLVGLRSLVMLRRTESDVAKAVEGRQGLLETNGTQLKGRLVDGREADVASCLNWHPNGSLIASSLTLTAVGKIVYRVPPPQPQTVTPAQPQVRVQQPGLGGALVQIFGGGNAGLPQPVRPKSGVVAPQTLHLRSGDTIPCEIVAMDEKGVSIKTPLSDATFVPHDKIKAAELLRPDSPIKLNKIKRERLLTLPRMQRDSPPTHMVRSTSGDFLRGRIVSLDERMLNIEVRLETKKLPRTRVAQIIWFHPDELPPLPGEKGSGAFATEETNGTGQQSTPATNNNGDSAEGGTGSRLTEQKPTDVAATDQPAGTKKGAVELGKFRVQALRADGIRLTFFAHEMTGTKLAGESDVIGKCHAELASIDQLFFGSAIEAAAAELTYHKWKLQHAQDPKYVLASDHSPDDNRPPGLDSGLVGKPAPEIELDQLDGKKFRLSNLKGKVVILDFWATWCGPCLKAMPEIDKVAHEFADRDVHLVAVNLEEAPKQIKATLERHKLSPTVAMDIDGVAAHKYEATAIPQTVIVDRKGNVARVFVGGGPKLADDLRAALEEVLKQE